MFQNYAEQEPEQVTTTAPATPPEIQILKSIDGRLKTINGSLVVIGVLLLLLLLRSCVA